MRWSDSVVGGSACGWVSQLVMGESVVVGSVRRNRWWEDRPMNGFQRMGRQWVGWQWQWVGVWDAVGQWVAAVVCVCVCVFIRWCW